MRTFIVSTVFCISSATVIAQDAVLNFRSEASWPALIQDRHLTISGDESKLVTVMKKRHNACLNELRNRFTYWLQSTGTLESVCSNLDRFVASHRGLGLSREDELQLHNDKLAFAQSIQRHAEFTLKQHNRTVNVIDVHFARYYALNAEVELHQLMKGKSKTDNHKGPDR